jgi:hypothetical protein
MALLDGILGGAQTAMAFGQQQTANKLARDRYDLDVSRLGEQKRQYDQSFDQTEKKNAEDIRQYDQTFDESVRQFNAGEVYKKYDLDMLKKEDAVAATRAANNELFRTYANAGYLSTDMQNLNYKQINDDIAKGRNSDRFATAEQLVLGMATQFGNLPEGSTATSVEALDDGGYAITVTNADGSKGAVTTDGSSEPTSTVVRFLPGQLGRLADLQYRTKIATNTDEFDPVSMSTSKNLIAADQEGQNAKAAFVEKQNQLNNLLKQVEATGNVELYRAVQSAIADGGDETAALIAKDFGLPSAQAPTAPAPTSADATPTQTPAQTDTQAPATPTQAPAQTDTQAPTATTPWSMDSVDRTTKSGRLIATIEGSVKNPNRRWSNKGPSQTEKLMARKAELQKNIEQPRVNPNPRSAGRNTTSTKKAAELMADKAELAQINAYIDKDKPALFTSPETDALAAQVEGKTTKQIAQGLDDGSITVDQQAINLVSQALKGQGLKTINDAAMSLNTRERAVARAAILATSKDPTIRNEMVRQMTSIFDTPYKSPNLDAKDVLDNQNNKANLKYNYDKLNSELRKNRRQLLNGANKEAAKVVTFALNTYTPDGKLNLGLESAEKFLRSPEFSEFNIWLKQSDREQDEIDNAVIGMTASISMTVASLAAEESGGRGPLGALRESLNDLVHRDETDEGFNPADFNLSQVTVDDPDVGADGVPKATMIYYTDGDGVILDEDAGLQQLKALHPEVYNNVVLIAIANTRKAIREKAKNASIEG